MKYATVSWTINDLDDIVPDHWTDEQRGKFLANNANRLSGAIVEFGYEALAALVSLEDNDEKETT